ncbi:hypothetical protein [Salimicrobium album]|uniref:CxxH/CxxC protein, BA_5709 family n=1 Tax=Salimicrobium album TaxID=50717 RepID=A0A1H3D6S4_9BACI|nr:hypothetical protein [Salimicrobium album]SDX62085.1 hypothetical protein SAMN04488081_0852 [Salimicrobium album]
MNTDGKVKLLKHQERAISEDIYKLRRDRRKVIEELQKICEHSRVEVLEPDPYLEENETQMKCLDCYEYLTGNEEDDQ